MSWKAYWIFYKQDIRFSVCATQKNHQIYLELCFNFCFLHDPIIVSARKFKKVHSEAMNLFMPQKCTIKIFHIQVIVCLTYSPFLFCIHSIRMKFYFLLLPENFLWKFYKLFLSAKFGAFAKYSLLFYYKVQGNVKWVSKRNATRHF